MDASARTLAAAKCRETERSMSAAQKPTDAALREAGRVWKCTAAVVSQRAMRMFGTRSAWLADHAGRPKRGMKGAQQLVRMVHEMSDAGFSLDEIDREIMALSRGIVRAATGTRPAA